MFEPVDAVGDLTRFVAVVCLLFSACSSAPTPGIQGKELTIYSGRKEELVGPLLERFEQATGIRLKVRYGDTAELAAQILEEGDRSPADIFFAQDAGALGALESKGHLIRLSESIVSKTPARFHSKTKRWTGVSGRARVAVFNPERVEASELPASIEGFTDTKWRDRLGWAPVNGSFQSFVTAFRKTKGEDEAKRWLNRMKANGTKSYPRNDAIVQAVSSDEIDVGFVNHIDVSELKRQIPNLKAENHFFAPGDICALVNVAGVGVLKTSKVQANAQGFIEFLLAPASQQHFADSNFEYPLVASVGGPSGLPPVGDISTVDVILTELSDLEGTLELLAEVGLL